MRVLLCLAVLALGSVSVAAAQVAPIINLPPNSGGETDGSDDLPPGAPGPEDEPDPSTPPDEVVPPGPEEPDTAPPDTEVVPVPEDTVEPEPSTTPEPAAREPQRPATRDKKSRRAKPVARRRSTPSPVPAAPAPFTAPAPALSVGAWYTVVPGDSLWAIAERVVGRHGAVGRFVAALWERNRARIGTAAPGRLPAGVVIFIPRPESAG